MLPDFNKWDHEDWTKAISLGIIGASVYEEHKRKQQSKQCTRERIDQHYKEELEAHIANLEARLKTSQPSENPT